jgi:hypothetical protein
MSSLKRVVLFICLHVLICISIYAFSLIVVKSFEVMFILFEKYIDYFGI